MLSITQAQMVSIMDATKRGPRRYAIWAYPGYPDSLVSTVVPAVYTLCPGLSLCTLKIGLNALDHALVHLPS